MNCGLFRESGNVLFLCLFISLCLLFCFDFLFWFLLLVSFCCWFYFVLLCLRGVQCVGVIPKWSCGQFCHYFVFHLAFDLIFPFVLFLFIILLLHKVYVSPWLLWSYQAVILMLRNVYFCYLFIYSDLVCFQTVF